MKPGVSLFVTFAVLFVAWLGYLAYLVFDRPQSPQVLSRPQFLVSQLDVVGVIDDRESELTKLDWLNAQSGAGEYAEAASLAQLIQSVPAGPFGPTAALSLPTVKAHKVAIQQVLYPPDAPLKVGDVLAVTNLYKDKVQLRNQPLPPKPGTLGPCLLPLETHDGRQTSQVVPVPPSPGFNNPYEYRYRIYAADQEALAQYRQIAKPEPATPPD
jgi:hypothetical protein